MSHKASSFSQIKNKPRAWRLMVMFVRTGYHNAGDGIKQKIRTCVRTPFVSIFIRTVRIKNNKGYLQREVSGIKLDALQNFNATHFLNTQYSLWILQSCNHFKNLLGFNKKKIHDNYFFKETLPRFTHAKTLSKIVMWKEPQKRNDNKREAFKSSVICRHIGTRYSSFSSSSTCSLSNPRCLYYPPL